MNQEVNVLALVKGKERYVFLYTDQKREEIVETFGRYASDRELSFTWLDAATLTQKAIREKRDSELVAARKQMRRRAAKRKNIVDPALFKDVANPFDAADGF